MVKATSSEDMELFPKTNSPSATRLLFGVQSPRVSRQECLHINHLTREFSRQVLTKSFQITVSTIIDD